MVEHIPEQPKVNAPAACMTEASARVFSWNVTCCGTQ